MTAHLGNGRKAEALQVTLSSPERDCLRGGVSSGPTEIRRLGPGQDRAAQAHVRRERRRLCRAPGAQTAAAQGSPEPSAIFTAWQQSLAGVKLCKPSRKNPTPKKLHSVVRFAFHQIVLANSILNLLSDPRLTDAIDDDPRNHFRTPISGTTRLARRAAAQMYGLWKEHTVLM